MAARYAQAAHRPCVYAVVFWRSLPDGASFAFLAALCQQGQTARKSDPACMTALTGTRGRRSAGEV